MRVSWVIATATLSVTCLFGATSPASARPRTTACAKADRSIDTLQTREQKLANNVSRLQTAIATVPDETVAQKLQHRLDRLQAREQKLSDAISKIQSACAGH